jgi:uncharacterized protein YuzE
LDLPVAVSFRRRENAFGAGVVDEDEQSSDQDKPGVILDYDAGGNLAGFEILDASKRMANPMSVEYAVTPPLRRPA